MLKTVLVVCLSVLASILFNYGLFLQKKAVDTLPDVKFELSWKVFKAFVTHGTWMFSVFLTIIGGAIYTVCIALAPISIVQPILGCGVALLAYLAIKNLGEKPRRSDLFAIGLNILGLVLIGISLAEGLPEKTVHNPTKLWILAALAFSLAIIFPLVTLGSSRMKQSVGLGLSVGFLYGIGAVFARVLLVDWTGRWPKQGIMAAFSSIFIIPWAASYFPAFIMLQAALQRGLAVVITPIVAGLSQLIPIVGGMIALNEPFPKNPALTVIRCVAFGMILLGTIILSRRAEEAEHG